MRNDPNRREPRAPAIAIWTLCGVLVGVAGGIVLGSYLFPVVVGAALGLLYGLFTTRPTEYPDDD